MAYYTSKYSGEDFDRALDQVLADAATLSTQYTALETELETLKARVAELEAKA
ncbi:hypothetical protein [Intestinibacillus massiliensis]|uniref:hypothetical protein n=1 Tax=Intestinibacillus massiliensis TaxID=1871029 RepID=UPI0013564905|nr:hypothetical protein [Intestinibacillus massiliensis]